MAVLHFVILLSTFTTIASSRWDQCFTESVKRPNIVFILADDLGWGDVSFHGSKQIPTPNIDAIARDGIILNQHYTQLMCSPSRAALMTGRHPIHLGFQHAIISANAPWGLSSNETILPEYLKFLNYATHGIGKWHLGFSKSEYLPHNRGFDSYFGFWAGVEDYFTHFADQDNVTGLDLHHNCESLWQYNGTYGTDLYTDWAKKVIQEHNQEKPLFLFLSQQGVHSGNFHSVPLQCPEKYKKPLIGINHEGRHTFAGMVSALDNSVGEVFAALEKSKMLDNTIFIFTTDNGAAVEGLSGTYGSNYPLRGSKYTLFEGGIRGVAFIWSPRLRLRRYIYNGLMHITDWLPTILSAIGGSEAQKILKNDKLYGVDQWAAITQDLPSPRQEILLNIDNDQESFGIRQGNFKLLKGSYHEGRFDGFFSQQGILMKTKSSDLTLEQRLLYRANYLHFLDRSKAAKVLWQKYGRKPRLAGSCQTPNCEELLELECGPRPEWETCNVLEEVCLFDLSTDPCEMYNLAEKLPEVVQLLQDTINEYRSSLVPNAEKPEDLKADPALYGNVWVPWESSCCKVKGCCMSNTTDEEETTEEGLCVSASTTIKPFYTTFYTAHVNVFIYLIFQIFLFKNSR